MLINFLVLLYIGLFIGIFGLLSFSWFSNNVKQAPEKNPLDGPYVFWFGLAWLGVSITILSLLGSIGLPIHLLLLSCILCYGIWKRDQIKETFYSFKWSRINKPILITLLAFFFLALLLKSVDGYFHYDTGLYHTQTIKWIETYSVVPGLGNLHGRLAFNSSWLLLSALFGLEFLGLGRFYMLNIFAILVSFWLFISKAARLPEEKKTSNLLALLLLLFSILYLSIDAGSPVTDIPAALLIWITFMLLIEKLEDKSLAEWDLRSWIILTLSVFAITVKLSTGPILLIPAYLWIHSIKANRTSLVAAIILVVLMLMPWLIRNVILSGYLIYPVTALRIPGLDWVVSAEQVLQEADLIRSWAISPGRDPAVILKMPFDEWLSAWAANQSILNLTLFVTGGFGTLFLLIKDGLRLLWNHRKMVSNKIESEWLFLDILMIVALSYWFFTAPVTRFGYGWIVVAFVYVCYRAFGRFLYHRAFFLTVSAFTLVVITFLTMAIIMNLSNPNLLLPASLPEIETTVYQTKSGLTIYQPALLKNNMCWDAPLPCSPYSNPELSLRGDDLSSGFRVVDTGVVSNTLSP